MSPEHIVYSNQAFSPGQHSAYTAQYSQPSSAIAMPSYSDFSSNDALQNQHFFQPPALLDIDDEPMAYDHNIPIPPFNQTFPNHSNSNFSTKY